MTPDAGLRAEAEHPRDQRAGQAAQGGEAARHAAPAGGRHQGGLLLHLRNHAPHVRAHPGTPRPQHPPPQRSLATSRREQQQRRRASHGRLAARDGLASATPAAAAASAADA
eukprot:scaffold1852_cov282-Prasinococcus_capsulatus_cf.AAC.3